MDRTVTEAKYTINDLPDEVIEFVLSFVPPYKDLHDCMQVCKRWRTSVLNVVRLKRKKLQKALLEFNIQWQCPNTIQNARTIAKRFSHCAVVHENSMYVFGGCTNTLTTFNDLWKLDLSRRQWVRPLATGRYPFPKACSSLVCYKDILVLFGGLAYPCSYPYHQTYQLFNELHTFNIHENKWTCITNSSEGSPPPMAGHSVSIHGKYMVVFGGMQRTDPDGPLIKTNDVWTLDLETMEWRLAEIHGLKPRVRYGQSQTALDDKHALIMWGCGGPNGLYNDVWLLTMDNQWSWKQVMVRNRQWGPPEIWCHPTCRVGDHIVVLNPRQMGPGQGRWRPTPANIQPSIARSRRQNEENVNGKRGVLERRNEAPERRNEVDKRKDFPAARVVEPSTSRVRVHDEISSYLKLAAFQPPNPTRTIHPEHRERQLELLRKMEEKLMQNREEDEVAAVKPNNEMKNRRKKSLCLYLLEITGALGPEPYVSWVQPTTSEWPDWPGGPEETLLYTLVHGKAELIMFGGIQKDNDVGSLMLEDFDPNPATTKVSSSLHFISAPLHVI